MNWNRRREHRCSVVSKSRESRELKVRGSVLVPAALSRRVFVCGPFCAPVPRTPRVWGRVGSSRATPGSVCFSHRELLPRQHVFRPTFRIELRKCARPLVSAALTCSGESADPRPRSSPNCPSLPASTIAAGLESSVISARVVLGTGEEQLRRRSAEWRSVRSLRARLLCSPCRPISLQTEQLLGQSAAFNSLRCSDHVRSGVKMAA